MQPGAPQRPTFLARSPKLVCTGCLVSGVGEWVSGGWMGQNHRTEDAVMDTELEPEELHEFFFDLDVSLSSSGPLIGVRTLSHSPASA